MRNVMLIQRPDLFTLQGHQRHGMAVVSYKLHLKRRPITMHQHGGPHISAHQAMIGQIAGQCHHIKFTDRFHGFESG